MSQINFTTEILNFQAISKISTSTNKDTYNIFLETPAREHVCPCCGETTKYIHDYRVQKFKDLPINNLKTIIHLKKRRYICKHCGKKFYEHYQTLAKFAKTSCRVKHSVLYHSKNFLPMKLIAKNHNISASTVFRYFKDLELSGEPLGEVLSIDEFRGNSNGEKFQVVLANPIKKELNDILKCRNAIYLDQYFKQLKGKTNVKFVVMDMWRPYFQLAKKHFKNAEIVIDRYHFIRQIDWAIENIRKRVQQRLSKEDRILFKHSRKLLLKPTTTMEEQDLLYRMFSISYDLEQAYQVKKWFYEILKLRDKVKVKKELLNWIQATRETEIKEFSECIRAYKNWLDPICNGIVQPYSNGYIEGINNKIKVLKRNSFCIRNFEILRKRILYMQQKSLPA